MINCAEDIDEFTRLKAEEDPRTIPEMKAEDEWQEGTITAVTPYGDGDGWAVDWCKEREGSGDAAWASSRRSLGCGVPRVEGAPEPAVGGTIRLYGSDLGWSFHGIDINGQEVFWRTPWERFAERVRWLSSYDRERRERFIAERAKLDEDRGR